MIRRAGIALGSNLGDPERQIREAVAALAALAAPGEPFLQAGLLRTAPVDCPPGSPDFLNTVVEMAWAGDAAALHEETKRIEHEAGRISSTIRNAPRLIDLDLLYLGGEILSSPALTLPHPRAAVRAFVLAPLAEIRPELVLPGQRETVTRLLAQLPPRL